MNKTAQHLTGNSHTLNGVTYLLLDEVQTTAEMVTTLPNAARDMESRGLYGMGTVRRPNGRKASCGFFNRRGELCGLVGMGW